jgi:NAD(P)-dependent dehydrogenase (short-subunit alcohol dehydrogenase family)
MNILLTGATAGIGKETAFALAQKAQTLLLPVRNLAKGEEVKKEILQKNPQAQIRLYTCDLASMQSIKDFSEQVKQDFTNIDVLINNAGLWQNKFDTSTDGIELTWAVNHLAPFLLTNLLLDSLKKSKNARIVNVASDLHQGEINWQDVEFRKNFSGLNAYKQSKLANILFTRLLAEKLKDSSITANALMPGFIATDIFRKMPSFVRWLIPFFAKTPKQGAETTIYLATSPEVASISGEYFKDKKRASSSHQSKNMSSAQKLWELSEQYVQKYF